MVLGVRVAGGGVGVVVEPCGCVVSPASPMVLVLRGGAVAVVVGADGVTVLLDGPAQRCWSAQQSPSRLHDASQKQVPSDERPIAQRAWHER